MNRNISRNASEIINMFTTAMQEQQLESDKHEFNKLKEEINKKHKKYLGDKYKEEESLSKNIQNAEKFKNMEEHRLPLEEFAKMFETDLQNGLTDVEAKRRLKQDGENRLTERKGTHWSLLLFKELANPFALLLWAGAILAFVAYGLYPADPSNLYLGIVLIVVILFVGFLNFYETMKSRAIMASFKDFIPSTTIVIRNGQAQTINASQLVRGDLIKVESGKKIPADIRIVWSQAMKVDNSSLTGQTQLLPRTVECTNLTNPLETHNIAFFSTTCRQGSGKGIVMFTGDKTFIGQIATLASLATQEISPLAQEIDRFVKRLAIFAIASGVIFFIAGFILGYPAITNFIFAVGIIVGNVPNGLLAEVTVALTLTAKKLSTKKVLCKTLEAVETLGSTSCICSDKTGTLTQNKMTATHLWYDGEIFKAANKEKEGKDYRYQYDFNSNGFKTLQQTAVVCSVATFDPSLPSQKVNKINNNERLKPKQKQALLESQKLKWQQELKRTPYYQRQTMGDASESALIKFFQPFEDVEEFRKNYKVCIGKDDRQCKIPFNSAYKYAFSINYYKNNPKQLAVFTKGAPQKIWQRCTHVMVDGKPVRKDISWNKKFQDANLTFGKNGQRVLGFAQLLLPSDIYTKDFNFNLEKPNFPFDQQCFVGMLSLSDPPRDSVPYSVLKCQAAGIKVIMVTGDQPVTAASIARQCHIITEQKTVNEIAKEKKISFQEAFQMSNAIVIHGDELTKMAVEDQGLPQSQQGKKLQNWLTKPEIVFARTTPAQKLIIVKGCQKIGHIVAVTGDGVNDSPAIKKADIGISMGITGTDVAKDAADMILLNDDFSAIVIGVEQGRRIFDNLKKAICYVMTSQICQIAPFIALIIFNFPVPVSPIILLYIDLGTDLVPAISYAYEEAQLDLMTRKPRNREQHLVTMKLMGQAYGNYGWCAFWGCIFNYFIVMNDFGFAPRDILNKNTIRVYHHNEADIYNPSDPYFGNTKIRGSTSCPESLQIDWLYTVTSMQDLRMAALTCSNNNGNVTFTQNLKFSECKVYQISPFTNKPVCYTTEAAKYAQSAFFYAVVVCQYFNLVICKTRKLSILQHGFGNRMSFFGIIIEWLLTIAVAYFYAFNVAFGTRDNIFMHFGVMAIPFGLLNLLFDEFRKLLIRRLPPDDKGKPNFVQRNTMW